MTRLIEFPRAASHRAEGHRPAPEGGDVEFLSTDWGLVFDTGAGDAVTQGTADMSDAPAKVVDWSNQDLASLYRAQRTLALAGLAIETDRGVTDEGDPWFIFLDRGGEVFAHISRVDGLYVLDSLAQSRSLRARKLEELVAIFAEDQKDAARQDETRVVSLAQRRSSTIRLHPGTLLAGLIWSIYLLAEDLLTPANRTLDWAANDDEALPDAPLSDSPAAAADLAAGHGTRLADQDDAQGVMPDDGSKLGQARSLAAPPAQKESLLAAVSTAGTGALLPSSVLFGLSTLSISFAIDTWKAEQSALMVLETGSDLHIALPVLEAIEQLDIAGDAFHAAVPAEVLAPEDAAAGSEAAAGSAVLATFDVAGLLTKVVEIAEAVVGTTLVQSVEAVDERLASLSDLAGRGIADPQSPSDGAAQLSLMALAASAQSQSFQQVRSLLTDTFGIDEIETAAFLKLAQATNIAPAIETIVEDVARALDPLPAQGNTPPDGSFAFYDETVRAFIDFLMHKSDDMKVVSLSKEVVLIDLDAFDGQGEVYARSWAFESGGTISTIGLKSDFMAFDLVA